MNASRSARVAGVAALALGASVAFGLPAQAKDGGHGASTHGSCSGTSTYKVIANAHKDTIVVKAKINSDAAGELWNYYINDNGNTVASGDSTTRHNGKLIVRQTIPNLDGTDTIDFVATDAVTGETCTAEVVVKQ